MSWSRPDAASWSRVAVAAVVVAGAVSAAGCRKHEPPPDLLKSQRDAMERAKGVGETMQKSVDAEGRKADDEGR